MDTLTHVASPDATSARVYAAGAFSDRRVVLHRVGEPGYEGDQWSEGAVGMWQSEHGPAHLVLGQFAPRQALERAAERFGLDLATLVSFQSPS